MNRNEYIKCLNEFLADLNVVERAGSISYH